MYPPRPFREDRRDVLVAAMRDLQFAALVVGTANRMEVVHLPLVVRESDEGLRLEGHVALTNPLASAASNAEALAIYQGPHAYIHPGWYETKQRTGRAVPTWNYVAVHARGPIVLERNPAWLHRHLAELTDANEAHRAERWAIGDAPADYIAGLVRNIVGLRVEVRELAGLWKMNQHHSEANRSGTIAGLLAEESPGADAVARIMADDNGELPARRT